MKTILVVIVLVYMCSVGHCETIFEDNFTTIDSQWQTQNGIWHKTLDGKLNDRKSYGYAHYESGKTRLPSLITLPFVLHNFDLEFDTTISDGGVWLHLQPNTVEEGVFLHLGGDNYFKNPNVGGKALYFEIGSHANEKGRVDNVFTPGDNHHITVKVRGNIYSAFSENQHISTIIDDTYSNVGGTIGFNDSWSPGDSTYPNFIIDNVALKTPTPSTPIMLLMFTLGLILCHRNIFKIRKNK